MQATETHEQVGGFLALKLGVQIERLALPYLIPRQGIIKAVDSDTAHSTFMKYTRLSLVGTRRKPLSLPSFRHGESLCPYNSQTRNLLYIGNPKQATISVYQLVDGEYVVNQFRGDDAVRSLAFPDLNLKAKQIFHVGQ